MKLTTKAAVLLALVSGVSIASAQTAAWTARHNESNTADYGVKVLVDSSRSVYVGGYTIGAGQGANMMVVKYSSNGVRLWTRTINGTGNSSDQVRTMALAPGGGVYVGGHITDSGTGSLFAVAKISDTGSHEWTYKYNHPGGGDNCSALKVDNQGNVLATGTGGTGTAIVTVKVTPVGTQSWIRTFTNPNAFVPSNIAHNLTLDGNNNAYVVGSTENGATGDDMLVLKYSPSGTLLFSYLKNGPYGQNTSQPYPGYVEDAAYACHFDANQSALYVTGTVMTALFFSNGSYYPIKNYMTLKLNNNGGEIWTRQLNAVSGENEAFALAVNDLGQVYITGNGGTAKYTANGTQEFHVAYNAVAIKVDSAGSAYLCGTSNNDYRTLKLNGATGSVTSTILYNGPGSGNDAPTDIELDATRNIYVTGASWGGATETDAATIKYVQTPYVEVQLTHSYQGDVVVEVGVGDPSNPLYSKVIRNREGGATNGQTTMIESIFDAPEFYQTPSESVVWYCKVSDQINGDGGTLDRFRIVTSGGLYTSGNIPQGIPTVGTVHAYVPTRTSRYALIDIEHTFRGDIYLTIGRGNPTNPAWSKVVSMYTGHGLDGMWAQVDLTLQSGSLPPNYQNMWWVSVYDGGGSDIGQIRSAKIVVDGVTYAANCVPAPIADFQTTRVFVPKLQGDANCDGCVDDSDLAAILSAFGSVGQNMVEDVNGDGHVDDVDLAIVLSNFGLGC